MQGGKGRKDRKVQAVRKKMTGVRVARKLTDESGVSMVFACLAMVVLFVIGGIVIAYGYNNYSRAVEDKQVGTNYDAVDVVSKSLRADCMSDSVIGKTFDTPASGTYANPFGLFVTAINTASTGSAWSDTVTVTGKDASDTDRTSTAQVTCARTETGEFGEQYTFTVLGGSGNATSMAFTVDVQVATTKDSKGDAVTTRKIEKGTVSTIRKVVR